MNELNLETKRQYMYLLQMLPSVRRFYHLATFLIHRYFKKIWSYISLTYLLIHSLTYLLSYLVT